MLFLKTSENKIVEKRELLVGINFCNYSCQKKDYLEGKLLHENEAHIQVRTS